MNVSNGLDAAILAVSRTAADHADEVDRASRIPEEAVRALQTQAMMGLLIRPRSAAPAAACRRSPRCVTRWGNPADRRR